MVLKQLPWEVRAFSAKAKAVNVMSLTYTEGRRMLECLSWHHPLLGVASAQETLMNVLGGSYQTAPFKLSGCCVTLYTLIQKFWNGTHYCKSWQCSPRNTPYLEAIAETCLTSLSSSALSNTMRMHSNLYSPILLSSSTFSLRQRSFSQHCLLSHWNPLWPLRRLMLSKFLIKILKNCQVLVLV